jgi:mannose-6-phosphate isomerase-like protein (cupin superfamily)
VLTQGHDRALEGTGTFSEGTDERVVGPGDVVIVPPEEPHAFVNSGETPLRQITSISVRASSPTGWNSGRKSDGR